MSFHNYNVSVEWSGSYTGSGTVKGDNSGIRNPLAVGKEYNGTGAGTNPEELLAEAVASCYSITYGIIAANRKIPLVKIATQATGEVEQNGPSLTYKSVTLKPTITLEADATEDQVKLADEMAHKADLYCVITNALRDKVAIKVEPNIVKS